MLEFCKLFLTIVSIFFAIYLLFYSTYLFLSALVGSVVLYNNRYRHIMKNQINHDYTVPVSIIVPAYNEEITVVKTVESLLRLDYKLFEIIVVDDGSTDKTAKVLIDNFGMQKTSRPIHKQLNCKKETELYETSEYKVPITLIRKENGGKADSLNMGINASNYPYFICMDADSTLQVDSLKNITRPILEDNRIVATGGIVRIANGTVMKNGFASAYHMPRNLLVSMQVLEYDRSFLASRILFDQFNGNLIISGAFGLFKKELVIECGGYDKENFGEDFELVVKLHVYCRSHNIDYRIKYIPEAICWTQVPDNLRDLCKQRRRWNIGLSQSMFKYREMFSNPKYGLVSFISYYYFLFYELLSPFIELFGVFTMILAYKMDLLNVPFMILFFLIYAIFGGVLSFTTFLARIHVENLKLSFRDLIKAVFISMFEITILRTILVVVRFFSFFGRKHKRTWGQIKRYNVEEAS